MNEFTTTRHNHLIDPALHIWGWEIPVYLFLGGMVAGMMVISGWFLFAGRHRNTRCSCFLLPGLAIVCPLWYHRWCALVSLRRAGTVLA